MAIGRRCSSGCTGSESWPDENQYSTCPICEEPTTRYSNLRILDPNEAAELVFEKYYEHYCARNHQPLEGGLPMSPEDSLFWDGKYPDGKSADKRG